MYACATCTEIFYYCDDCEKHMDDYSHWIVCDTCPHQFGSRRACNQHMDAFNHHAPLFKCETCGLLSYIEEAIKQHMGDLDHWATFCVPCNRKFNNNNNLRMHRNSRIHRGANVSCPFCKTGFTSASGVSHHVETGSCPKAPRMNRDSVLRIIQAADRKGLITNKQIEWNEAENVEYIVTNRVFNGDFWECYICHRGFNTSRALTQHLNSPVHKQKAYHCPGYNCSKEFNSLAALLSHFESESCGYMRFERVQQVQKSLNDVIMGRKQLYSL